MARALSGSPGVILADEPTAALDSLSGRNVMEMMRDLAHKHGRGVVVVTHDSRVLEFGDRIVHMEDRKDRRTGCGSSSLARGREEMKRRILTISAIVAAGWADGISDLGADDRRRARSQRSRQRQSS